MNEPRLKWFKFSHAVLAGETTLRPFFALHLVDVLATPNGSMQPDCGDASATIITDADEPRGFYLACCRCLARSELANV